MNFLNFKKLFIEKFSFLKWNDHFFNRLMLRSILDKFYFLFNKITFKRIDKSKAFLIWDVRCCSISFDFIFFIFDAFMFFSKEGLSTFDLIIYFPIEYDIKPTSYNSYSKFITGNDLKKRIENLIIPIAQSSCLIKNIFIIKSIEEYYSFNKKNSKFIFPEYYHPKYYYHNGINYKRIYKNLLSKSSTFSPHIKSKLDLNNILEKIPIKTRIEKYITLSLRDYGFSPERNTTSKDLIIASDFAEMIGAKLLIIPDEEKNLKNYDLPNKSIICSFARKNLYDRISLYKYSEANLFTPAGPAALSLFIEGSKTIILKYGVSNSIDSSPEYYKKTYDINVNDQPYFNLNGYVIWQNRDKNCLKQVKDAYDKLVLNINKS